jgi:regulator of cell morphogenesis and NO signaling
MQITSDTRVADIATHVPAALEVFERYQIDFSCGGDIPLGKAAELTGRSVGDLIAEIERAAEALRAEDKLHENWVHSRPDRLIAHIVDTHHRYLREHLPVVGEELARTLLADGDLHDELFELGRVFARLQSELAEHLRSEETELFPALSALAAGTEQQNPIEPGTRDEIEAGLRMAELTHERVGDLLKRMRAEVEGYSVPPDVCPTYGPLFQHLMELEADIHRHVHLENNVLFPGMRRLLAV